MPRKRHRWILLTLVAGLACAALIVLLRDADRPADTDANRTNAESGQSRDELEDRTAGQRIPVRREELVEDSAPVRTVTLVGRVLAAHGRAPLSALVSVKSGSTWTDPTTGQFCLQTPVDSIGFELTADALGFVPRVIRLAPQAGPRLDVDVILLESTAMTSILVVDPHGEPANGAVVTLTRPTYQTPVTTQTDDRGRTSLAIPQGGTVHAEQGATSSELVAVGLGQAELTLTLKPSPGLRFEHEQTGSPLPNLPIRLNSLDAAGSMARNLVTDATGLIVEPVPPGRYLVASRDPTTRLHRRFNPLASNSEPRPVPVRLTSGETVTILGTPSDRLLVRLIDRVSQEPLPSCTVWIHQPFVGDDWLTESIHRQLQSEGGRIPIPERAAEVMAASRENKPISLVFWSPGYAATAITAADLGSDLEEVVVPLGPLPSTWTLELRTEDGAEYRGPLHLSESFQDPVGFEPLFHTAATPDSSLDSTRWKGGDLVVQAGAFESVIPRTRLAEGGTMQILLPASSRIEVTEVPANSRPDLIAYQTNSRGSLSTVPGRRASNSLFFDSLTPGSYRIVPRPFPGECSATILRQLPDPVVVDVQPNTHHTIRFRPDWVSPPDVHGHVEVHGPAPAQLFASPIFTDKIYDWMLWRIPVREDGYYSLDGLHQTPRLYLAYWVDDDAQIIPLGTSSEHRFTITTSSLTITDVNWRAPGVLGAQIHTSLPAISCVPSWAYAAGDDGSVHWPCVPASLRQVTLANDRVLKEVDVTPTAGSHANLSVALD